MSIVTYGNPPVTLAYAHHTTFNQEAVYDDQGEVERLYTRYDLTVESVINFTYLGVIAPDLVGRTKDAATIMNVIRGRLLEPRQPLHVKLNDVDLIPLPQTGLPGTVDAKNGPLPQYCNLTQLTNTTLLMQWRCIAHYTEAPSFDVEGDQNLPVDNPPGNPVLSNRWTETVDLDDCQYSRRIREGKLIVRSDNFFGVIADTLRTAMAVTGVPPGFLRESSSYTVDPSGLRLAYRVVDKEQFRMPPPPAFWAKGTYTETAVRTKGVYRYGEVNLQLKGDKNTSQEDLVTAAVKVASAKIRLPGATLNTRGLIIALIENFVVEVDMYENSVRVHLRALLKAAGQNQTEGVWGMDYQKITFIPGSSDITGYTPTYKDRGTASLLLESARYWDPALIGNSLNRSTDQFFTGLPIGSAGVNKEP